MCVSPYSKPVFFTSFCNATASRRSNVAGLSLNTWNPFSSASFAGGKWTWFGVTIATKSIRSPNGSRDSAAIISWKLP